jgi:hypothetical protein
MKNKLISYYYFGIPYKLGYMELLDTKRDPFRRDSKEELLKHINEARLMAKGHPLYLIKETTEAEKI